MAEIQIANIVRKITELSKRDKAVFVKILKEISKSEGGGGSSDSIKVTPQELTEVQKMQARKNQGLYYEEDGIGDKTVICDSNNPPEDWKDTAFGLVDTQVVTSTLYVKVSDDIPDINKWGDIIDNSKELIENPVFIQKNGYYAIKDQYDEIVIIVIQNEGDVEVEGIGTAHETGIYIKSSIETDRTTDRNSWNFNIFQVDSITYEGPTTIVNQIPSKYIPNEVKFNAFEIVLDYSEFISLINGNVSSLELNINFNDIVDACNKGEILILKIVDNDNTTLVKYPIQLIGTNNGRVVAEGTSPYGFPCFIFNYIRTLFDGTGKPTGHYRKVIYLYLGENENYEEVTKLIIGDAS